MSLIDQIPVTHFIILSVLLFFIGIYGFITRRNLFTILMSTELILNAGAINFAVFNRYLYDNLQGHFFTLFIIGIAAAEAAVAIAIIINVYRSMKGIDSESLDQMKY